MTALKALTIELAAKTVTVPVSVEPHFKVFVAGFDEVVATTGLGSDVEVEEPGVVVATTVVVGIVDSDDTTAPPHAATNSKPKRTTRCMTSW